MEVCLASPGYADKEKPVSNRKPTATEPRFKEGELVFYENYWTKFCGIVSEVVPPKGRDHGRSPGLYDTQHHYYLVDPDTKKPHGQYLPTPECDLRSKATYDKDIEEERNKWMSV
jgi:hypothetical protein